MANGGASDSEGSDISGIDEYILNILTAKRMDLNPVHASQGPGPACRGTVTGCQTCLTSLTKHDLKALTPTG